ncbi:PepSY-associated TM helix domain-containing protein [Methylicorpusculum sp.]|uniref:PepSY-associated TM helix domain-containing protein n=1 Tax=Methylicorpusculum sp. TaxID=2713644 RepID=UPI0027308AA0|nr:PepSY-associated TM helix domain-containing protein [Methylicorpusculum sp.]MDP2178897.1 PepSY-associated TM helix domain-containing protein [Methylicorpusculum sp.]MDP3530282.1 PepSY-associated TM helix domain-containing protein [Methylicorpusculum sp.]MDZ4151267.1 PepSY-associated TM helix domain-containing protein [Methylicorpusculum sp.]
MIEYEDMALQKILPQTLNKNHYKTSQWRRRFRSFWLTVHLYVALTIGFVFVILGLTGSFNVFIYELEELGLPQVRHEVNAQPRSLDEIMQTVKATHPEKKGKWSLLMPNYGNDYLWVEYPKPVETADELYAPFRVLIDPYSGRIIAESYWGQTLWTLIYEVHASFLTGKLGAEIGQIGFNTICFLGLFLFISTLTGLYLWWPRWGKFKKAVTIKRGASPERFYFDLHKTTGFYSSIILLILAFTGFSFSYVDYIKPLIRSFSAVKEKHLEEPDVKSKVIDNAKPLSIARAVAQADTVFPDAELRGVETPDGKEGVYSISKRQSGEANHRWSRSKVWIDQYSGKVLAVQDPNKFTAGETFINVLWPLHTGEALGLAGRILWCVMGFAPLVLYVSGIIRWLQKHRAKKAFKH